MTIAIGCDEIAFEMKEAVKQHVQSLGYAVEDYGVYDQTPVLYPDMAAKVAQAVAAGKHERGILICGTGIGMAITANKVPGIRAAQCHDPYSAERARKSNNAQIMTMGALVIGVELAKALVAIWLQSEFQGGRSQPKVDKMIEYDKQFRGK